MPSISDSKYILVTGATAGTPFASLFCLAQRTRGLGRALSLAIAKLPHSPTVVAAGRRPDRLEELKKSGLKTLQWDVNTDKETLKKDVEGILEQYPEVSRHARNLHHR